MASYLASEPPLFRESKMRPLDTAQVSAGALHLLAIGYVASNPEQKCQPRRVLRPNESASGNSNLGDPVALRTAELQAVTNPHRPFNKTTLGSPEA